MDRKVWSYTANEIKVCGRLKCFSLWLLSLDNSASEMIITYTGRHCINENFNVCIANVANISFDSIELVDLCMFPVQCHDSNVTISVFKKIESTDLMIKLATMYNAQLYITFRLD